MEERPTMANGSWPYNRDGNSIVAFRAQLDALDEDRLEDRGDGIYHASMASLVRAARDVEGDRPKPKPKPKRRLPFPRP
jgi:hypothetical protein